MSGEMEPILETLVEITDENRVRNDPFERRMYSHDLASLPKFMELAFKMMPDYVVRPVSSKEIAQIMVVASKNGIPVVPRGGASWGLGGAMPVGGGIVLDLTSMNRVIDVDEKNLTVKVQAGISWKYLYDHLLLKGYLLGSYPSSAMAATVGGWINTGGVGIGSYKYGSAKDQVVGLETILPTGAILGNGATVPEKFLGDGAEKLFYGAEGTLGIVTKVTLRIHPAPEELRPRSYAFKNMDDLAKAIVKITRMSVQPLHMGFLDKNHFEYLNEVHKSKKSVKFGGMLNITLAGDKRIIDIEEDMIDEAVKEFGGEKQDDKTSKHEWDERFYELRTKRIGPSAALGEVFIPVSSLGAMAEDTYKLIKRMKLRGAITGMVSDRNTIVFMPYYLSDERKVIRNLLSLSFVKKLGDLSYKHEGRPAGLGLFFSSGLKRMHGDGVYLMDGIKESMDPADVMNPGKTTEGLTKFGVPIPPIAMNVGMNVMSITKSVITKDKGV